jgi:uncharacterized protein YdiU (UPF0061 family)
MPIAFDNSYARLPERFFARMPPSAAPAPALLRLNEGLAQRLGIAAADLATPETAAWLAGAAVPDGAEPIAMAYAGHQFGNFVPQLGDGRAVLLGEVVAPDGARFDIHLKGAGRTPYSRGGDGKAVLSAVLREFLISEAMAALGIPTTRTLSAALTGERVMRDGHEPGAVLARVASSHVRVGTFQFFYARRDTEALQALLDHVIARHYPEAAETETPALGVLRGVMTRQADLVAQWMSVGFIHGVMNTDNMSIAGETIDYGPCAFMDAYHPGTVFSSIDRQGRYAWANQPGIAHWNLAQLAQSLLPLIDADEAVAVPKAQAALDGFADLYRAAWERRLLAKFGIGAAQSGDLALAERFLKALEDQGVDFTLAFRRLGLAGAGDASDLRALFGHPPDDWLEAWRGRIAGDQGAMRRMARANPVYIPRNHRVEAALAAANAGDMAPFDALRAVLAHPFDASDATAAYEDPPRPEEIVHQTFCGT